MAQSIAKNALYNVLLNIASVIFPLITAPYVSRVLEPDGVGLFNFSTTYAGYFALVAVLGIPTYGVREVSKARDDLKSLNRVVSQLVSIALIATLVVSAIYILSIAIIGKLNENFIIFLTAGFVIYLAPFKVNWYYQGVEEFGVITKVTLAVRTISVICLFLFVREKGDLIIYVIISVFGTIIADLWNFFKMYRSGVRPRLTFTGLKSHLSPLFILFASSIAISIYTVLDTLMLGFMTNYEEVGFYTNAMHISKVVVSAITSLSLVAVPRVSFYMKERDFNNINILLNKSFSVVSFFAFPATIGLACISPVFVPLFFGTKFVGSIMPLIILSFLIISIGLNNLTGVQVLIGMGFDKLFLYSVLTGTVSNFILNYTLIPGLGSVGASIASVVAETLILSVTAFFVYRYTPIRFNNWFDVIKSLIGALLFIPLIVVLNNYFDGWVLVAAFIILGGLVYVFVESLLKNDSIILFKSVLLSKIKNK